MNYQDIVKAREFYEKVAELCDVIDERGLWDKPAGSDVTLRDILQHDVANFIMYLSAADGRLSMEEVQAYRAITGFGGDNFESIKRNIEKNKIYSMDFESEPPLIMKLISQAERKAVMYGVRFESSALQPLAAMYRLIGAVIISIDGGISYTEKRDFGIIMNTIDGYARDHDIVGDAWSLFH